MKPSTSIRIAIADDHEIFREGLKSMIRKESTITLCGEAANGTQICKLVTRTPPDVILMDMIMPEMNGIEASRKITSAHPNIGIIALTMFDSEHLIVDALAAGASGYLLKNAGKAELLEAIYSVNRNIPYYSAAISSTLMNLLKDKLGSKPKELKLLNDIEINIIKLICEGLLSKEIGDQLELSIRTVEGYRTKIMRKIDAHNTTGIIMYAIKYGIYKMH